MAEKRRNGNLKSKCRNDISGADVTLTQLEIKRTHSVERQKPGGEKTADLHRNAAAWNAEWKK